MTRPFQRRASRAEGTTAQLARLRTALEGMTRFLPIGADGMGAPTCAYCSEDAEYSNELHGYVAKHAPDCAWVAGRAALAPQGDTNG